MSKNKSHFMDLKDKKEMYEDVMVELLKDFQFHIEQAKKYNNIIKIIDKYLFEIMKELKKESYNNE